MTTSLMSIRPGDILSANKTYTCESLHPVVFVNAFGKPGDERKEFRVLCNDGSLSGHFIVSEKYTTENYYWKLVELC